MFIHTLTNEIEVKNSCLTKRNLIFFIEEMFGNAVKDFKETEQYKLLQEKLDQMDRDCDTMLTADRKCFAVECF